MVKKLFLVRHAKAQQESVDNTDFSRELADRGLRDASLVGSYLKNNGYNVEMIISSPAARALATAELFATQLGYNPDNIHTNEELYLASVRTFLQAVNQLKDSWQQVMMVGHNPTITYLGEYMSDAEVGNMPTGSVMVLDFAADSWAALAQNSGTLAAFITPRMIKDGLV